MRFISVVRTLGLLALIAVLSLGYMPNLPMFAGQHDGYAYAYGGAGDDGDTEGENGEGGDAGDADSGDADGGDDCSGE